MSTAIDYASAGVFTDLTGVPSVVLDQVPDDPLQICALVPGLVVHPAEMPGERPAEQQIRPAAQILDALLALDASPLTHARPPQHRVVGTCRHFAVLACALLRHRGIAARARCGFATYFQEGKGLDHWIVEYRAGAADPWTRVDAQVMGDAVDLQPEQFLSGGEAWAAHRAETIDAAHFGVAGTSNWGPAEIRGNAIRDLASLAKVETLPWDEWGRMGESYKGQTGADYDQLMDVVASVCAFGDPSAVSALYTSSELRVPDELLR
ncbi:transglutaminase domain-containing protein [Actinoplanes sp. TFC3]|uniref:transglutaminase domain-containing protein n=1 Tax=Actinoplanes sp. TFC3 TaxID=1710355 RepID=UPI00082D96C5|nr:transglutaminase domain-containing protein [Actinoplanes sp. TFC3]